MRRRRFKLNKRQFVTPNIPSCSPTQSKMLEAPSDARPPCSTPGTGVYEVNQTRQTQSISLYVPSCSQTHSKTLKTPKGAETPCPAPGTLDASVLINIC